MKLRTLLSISVLAASLAFVSSCQNDEMPSNEEVIEYDKVILSVDPYDFGEDDIATKLTPSISSTSVTYLWAEGDTVGIYPDAGSQLVFPVAEFGSTTAAFDGGAWRLSSDHTYYAYVPYVPDILLNREKVPVSFLGQTQKANADATGLRDYVFMTAAGTPPTGQNLMFNFKRLGCLMLIDLPVDADTYTSLSVSVLDGTQMPVKGTFNLTETSSTAAPDLTITGSADAATLTLKNITIDSDNSTLTCYLMSAPIDLSGKTLKFTLVGSKGTTVYTAAGKTLKKSGASKFAPTKMEGVIDFADNEVKAVCVSQWDTNADGELEYTEAEAVTEIPANLFQYKSIKSFNELQYFTALTTIGERAFFNCSSLTSIDFPDGKAFTVGAEAFRLCRKMTVVDSTIKIDAADGYAFQNCENLTSVIELTENATTISDGTFSNCFKLETVVIPSTIAYIGSYAFQGCYKISSITLPDNIVAGPYQIFEGCRSITSFNIPSSWTEFGDGFFMGCTGLTNFVVPDHIVKLGGSSFQNCDNLVSITLPETLLSIGENCFKYCSSLESITIPSKIKEIVHGTFGNCSKLSTVNLPEGLVDISSRSDGAFADCPSLKTITLPSTLTSIGEYTFINSGLTSITIPDNVRFIGRAAFERCFDLTECTLSNSLTSLQIGTFQYAGLTSLIIPVSISAIYCELPGALKELYMLPTTPPSLINTKCIPDNDCPIYVPTTSVDTYKTAAIWSNYADRIQAMPGGSAGGSSGGDDQIN